MRRLTKDILQQKIKQNASLAGNGPHLTASSPVKNKGSASKAPDKAHFHEGSNLPTPSTEALRDTSLAELEMENTQFIYDFEACVNSVKTFVSTASVAANRLSSAFGGSVSDTILASDDGEPISTQRRFDIEGWASQVLTDEQTAVSDLESEIGSESTEIPFILRGTASSTTTRPIDPRSEESSEDTDFDTEIELELVQKLTERGQEHYDKQDFVNAKAVFHRVLEKVDLLGSATLFIVNEVDVRLKLSLCWLRLKKWDEVDKVIFSIIAPSTNEYAARIDISQKLQALHIMVETSVQHNDLDRAERCSREALKTTRKLFGNKHPSYHDAVAQLATVLRNKGQSIDADAFMSMLPSGFVCTPIISESIQTQEHSIPESTQTQEHSLSEQQLVEILSSYGFDQDFANDENKGLLWAVKAEKKDLIQFLLENRASADRAYREKLEQLENDYKTAVHYVKGTANILQRMRDELSKYKTQNTQLQIELEEAQAKASAQPGLFR